MDVNSLTDQELVAATNEYISRAISRTHECTGAAHVFISAYAYNRDKYSIDHNFSLGKPEVKLEGGNLFELVEKHKIIQNFPTTPASEIIPMLSAPEPLIEEAHFTEVSRNCFSGADDDMPF